MHLIQVCQSIRDPKTLERELAPLAVTARYFKLKEATILTLDEESEIVHDECRVRVAPIWKWMLEFSIRV